MFARNAFGAADPVAPDAAAPPVQTPQPAPAARTAVSRETSPYDMSAQDYARYQRDNRGMRGGLSALGDLGAAAIYRNRRDEAAGQPGIFQRMGNAISGAATALGAEPVPVQAPPGAAMPAQAPPGAPEPPRFPGGIPQPRPRPVLNPDLMRNDPALPGQLIPTDTVAGLDADRMGALVDPTTGYDYG